MGILEDDMRSRVENLLRNDFHVEDFTDLFMYLRDRCDGRQAVSEVGDFVAHRQERIKGPLTRTAKDFFTVVRFNWRHFGKQIDLSNVPPNFVEVLKATFRQLDPRFLRRDTGLSQRDARQLLEEITPKFRFKNFGIFSLQGLLSPIEIRLMDCLTSYIISLPAFTDDGLFEEWLNSLDSNGLLQKGDRKLLAQYKVALALYAISMMHGCTLNLGDGTKAELEARPSSENGITVYAAAEIADGQKKHLMSFPIFSTSIDPKGNCASELLDPVMVELPSGHKIPKEPEWNFALRITPERKLARRRRSP